MMRFTLVLAALVALALQSATAFTAGRPGRFGLTTAVEGRLEQPSLLVLGGAADDIQDGIDKAGDKAKDLVDSADSKADEAQSKAESAASDAKSKVKDGADEAADAAESAGNKAADKIDEASDKL